MSSHRVSFLALCVGSVACALSAGAQFNPRMNIVAITGTDGPGGPGMGPGVTFATLNRGYVMNASGRLAIPAEIRQPGVVGTTSGIWYGGGNTLTPLALASGAAPGLGSAIHSTFTGPFWLYIQRDGSVVFNTTLYNASDPIINNVPTYVSATPTSTTIIAQQRPAFGSPLPNPPANSYFTINSLQAGAGSAVSFYTNFGLRFGTASTNEYAAQFGQPVSGLPAGQVISNDALYSRDINRADQMLFGGSTLTPSGQRVEVMGIASAGRSAIVIRGDQIAPGTGGQQLGVLGDAAFSDDGRIMFRCQQGMFTWTAGTLRLSSRPGMQAPGFATGVNFALTQSAMPSTLGRFVFNGTLQGPGVSAGNQYGVWIDDGASIFNIAQAGRAMPSLSQGEVTNSMFAIRTNAVGQILLEGRLPGTSDPNNGPLVYWVWDPTLGTIPLLRSDRPLTLADGTTRTASQIYGINLLTLDPGALIPGTNTVYTGNSPTGVFICNAIFPDGTQAQLAMIVPAPGSALALSLLALPRRRRARH